MARTLTANKVLWLEAWTLELDQFHSQLCHLLTV